MDLAFLPAVNACLNGVATVLLVAGRIWIRRGRLDAHRRAMLSATAVSGLFLVSYVVHKASRGFQNTPFHASGPGRAAYLVLLFSHVTLAMTVPVLAGMLIWRALRGERERHRRLARLAWPIWLYVSVTGIAVYVLLYHLNPAPPG